MKTMAVIKNADSSEAIAVNICITIKQFSDFGCQNIYSEMFGEAVHSEHKKGGSYGTKRSNDFK